MEHFFELTNIKQGLNLNINLHSVNNYKLHLHNEIEILLVLKGSITVISGNKKYVLVENDYMLINACEVHSTSKTNEENACLALQLDPRSLDKLYPGFSKINFRCNSFECNEENQENYDKIRHYIANIIWAINKKEVGFEIDIEIEFLKIVKELLIYFNNGESQREDIKNSEDRNINIQRIMQYIDNNIEDGVTLEDVAENENMSSYYVSRFIKNNIGISFQEYKNHKRLDKAVELLTCTDKTITEIALSSGFPSVKSLNNIFKHYYKNSPSEYRKINSINIKEKDYINSNDDRIKSKSYLDINRNAAFTKLFTYLEPSKIKENKTIEKKIKIHMRQNGNLLIPYWKKLMTFGRAAEGLRQDWRNQLEEIQREIGFEYIRFHGIFCDEMMICNYDEQNNITYNWNYVDNLFDFFMKLNIKPFVGLNFMPSEIKKTNETMYWWKANISQPKDINLWVDLVKEFLKHCINRYGLKEVESWYFEVWNEPELEYVYWIGDKKDYFEFYKETVFAIKSISKNIKIGGPSITHQALKDGYWLEEFITYCLDNHVPLDIITLHIYPEIYSVAEENNMELMEGLKENRTNFENINISQLLSMVKNIYFDKNHTIDTINNAIERITAILPKKPEIHITEWSATALGRNLISDTCYTATFIARSIVQAIDTVDSIGYWTFTDIMEELKAGISPFHGGFGLINNNGIKKPGYFAYLFLSKLGREILIKGEDFIVTRKDDEIQILAYNFAYFDDLFLKGDTSALTYIERYKVFESKDNVENRIEIEGLSGNYKVTKYELNRDSGSAFDEWLMLGSPENMTIEEVEYLKMKSYPKMTTKYLNIKDNYSFNISLPVHGLELVIIRKIH